MSAWIVLAAVWSVVIGMIIFCYRKLLTSKRRLGSED
jgi:hypothetical protein